MKTRSFKSLFVFLVEVVDEVSGLDGYGVGSLKGFLLHRFHQELSLFGIIHDLNLAFSDELHLALVGQGLPYIWKIRITYFDITSGCIMFQISLYYYINQVDYYILSLIIINYNYIIFNIFYSAVLWTVGNSHAVKYGCARFVTVFGVRCAAAFSCYGPPIRITFASLSRMS